MKKIIFFTFLLLGSFCFSQSITKKYNSYSKQYEYFDSYGSMIAYEKYNSYSNQWEYYDLKSTQSQPYQYREPAKVDMSSTINAASVLQNRYDNNVQKLQSAITTISNQINNLDVDDEQKQVISNNFQKQVDELNKKNINYSSANETNRVIQWLYDSSNIIIKSSYGKSSDSNYYNSNSSDYYNSAKNKEIIAKRDNYFKSDKFKEEIANLKLKNKKNQTEKQRTNEYYMDMYSSKLVILDYVGLGNYCGNQLLCNEYKTLRKQFSQLTQNDELNEMNSKDLFQKMSDIVNKINYEGFFNKTLKVNRIAIFHPSTDKFSPDEKIINNSYIILKDNEILFRKADGTENYRNLADKKYNNVKHGYDYSSNWGAIFIHENLNYVEFFSDPKPMGDSYTYFISK